jgi:hypothetical protein
MKQVIRLTESDLHNIVRKAINELDWRTYQNAYEKEKPSDRAWKFRNAATNAFNRQNGYGIKGVPYGDSDDDTNFTYTKDSVYGTNGSMFTPRMTDPFCTISLSSDGSKIYSNQDVTTTNYGVKPDWETKSKRGEFDDLDSKVNASTYNPMLKMAQMKGDKQVRDYFQGKSKYKNGKWQ